MSARTPTDSERLVVAARIGGIEPEPQRLVQLVPVMNDFFALLDQLHRDELGETPPAIAFRAAWGDR